MSISSNINNTRNGDVVTSVLTIDNVSLNDNGTEYFCLPTFPIRSYIGAILIAGTCTYVHRYEYSVYVHIYVH